MVIWRIHIESFPGWTDSYGISTSDHHVTYVHYITPTTTNIVHVHHQQSSASKHLLLLLEALFLQLTSNQLFPIHYSIHHHHFTNVRIIFFIFVCCTLCTKTTISIIIIIINSQLVKFILLILILSAVITAIINVKCVIQQCCRFISHFIGWKIAKYTNLY